jgi:DNA-binding transcriptional regulator YiaG
MTPSDFKEARLKLGFSQSEMGEALRLSGDTARSVRKWERGEREISGPVSLAVEYLLEQQR